MLDGRNPFMDSRILDDPHSDPSGFINPYPDPSSSVDLHSKRQSSLRDQLQLQQQQQGNPTQMDPVYSQFLQTDPFVRSQEHSRTRTVPVLETFYEKDISHLQLLHQQQERNPTQSQFLPTDPSVRYQEHSRTRRVPELETINNEKDVNLIAAIDKRTVLRGLVREYIDSRRGILEIYQVGHSGLLSEPVAGSFNDLTCSSY
jgi:hypothetical protein